MMPRKNAPETYAVRLAVPIKPSSIPLQRLDETKRNESKQSILVVSFVRP